MADFILLCAPAFIIISIWIILRTHKKKPPTEPPPWPSNIYGFSYSPFRKGQHPKRNIFPTKNEIREDLKIMSAFTRNIRIYSVEGTQRYIPELAVECGLQVTLGAWLSKDEVRNEREVALCIKLANTVPSITRVLIGNEALFRNDVTEQQMLHYLDRVRDAVKVPVSTSEQWHIWVDFPELAGHVDFIAAHILPFWENLPMIKASGFVIKTAAELKRLFPKKPLLISEVGWPSGGGLTTQSRSSIADQSIYLRFQLQQLDDHNIEYFVVEAFDQRWKTDEGAAGQRWGVFYTDRKPKIIFSGPISESFQWQLYFTRWIRGSGSTVALKKRFLWPFILSYLALLGAGLEYSHPFPLPIGVLMTMAWATVLLVALGVETHEFIETACLPSEPRFFPPSKELIAYRPKVSIHVPCFNEPPEMVKTTLDSLSELNYADFEVLIIDNNTQNPSVWEPVRKHCEKLGHRFKFFHIDNLEGFKAGALNYLLSKTAIDAVIIAVIDADYCVERNWLKHTVPHFGVSDIAVVQAPQDYRDNQEHIFKKLCYSEYRGFFNIGMVIRNDYDAIIQHGTMTLIRKTVMEELGWAQWCICEDAELGLRALIRGYSMAYVRNSYGKGLIPDTFIDFKKQRFRWAYGAVQIMKRHSRSLIMGSSTKLSAAQRYYFLAGWLPWVAQGFNLLLMIAAVLWSVLIITEPQSFKPLPWVFSITPLLVLSLMSAKTIYLYDRLVTHDIKDALAAIVAGISLYHTIAKAVLFALFTTRMPFFRTPKNTDNQGLWVAISQSREEVIIMLVLWSTAAGIAWRQGLSNNDVLAWIVMLLVQALPYLAALLMAILSALPRTSLLRTPNRV